MKNPGNIRGFYCLGSTSGLCRDPVGRCFFFFFVCLFICFNCDKVLEMVAFNRSEYMGLISTRVKRGSRLEHSSPVTPFCFTRASGHRGATSRRRCCDGDARGTLCPPVAHVTSSALLEYLCVVCVCVCLGAAVEKRTPQGSSVCRVQLGAVRLLGPGGNSGRWEDTLRTNTAQTEAMADSASRMTKGDAQLLFSHPPLPPSGPWVSPRIREIGLKSPGTC